MADSDKVNLATLGAEAELVSLGTAVATVLTRLNEVSAQHQRSILQLVLGTGEAARAALSTGSSEERAPDMAMDTTSGSFPALERSAEGSAAGVHPDEARARALAFVYEAAAQALGVAFQNAARNQQQLNGLGQAALAQSINRVLSRSAPSEDGAMGVLRAG